MRGLLDRLLVRLSPPRWRESIVGDLDEERRGTAAALWHGGRLLARLWLEELAAAIDERAAARSAARSQGRSPMHALSMHVRQAARSLITRPAYVLIVILTLGIGIGANASVFALANWLMLRPLPSVHDPSGLVTMRFTAGNGNFTISHVELEIVKREVPAIASLAGSMEASFNLAAAGATPERVEGAIVSANYFDVLGVRPSVGRSFSDTEQGVVVSHGYWRSRLGGDVNIIGRMALVNGQPQPIVGIAPRGFTGTSRSSAVQVWVPSNLKAMTFPGSGQKRDLLADIQASLYITLFARLHPGATVDTVAASLESAKAAIMRVHPRRGRIERMTIEAAAGVAEPAYQRKRLGDIFVLLLAMVGLLLVLTCANVGNVVLANGASRRAEIATRQAVGASRAQVVTGVLVECLLLSLASALVAIAIAAAIGVFMRGTIVLPFLAALGEVSIDTRVFAFAFIVATLAAVGAGLLPALSATRFDLLSVLKGTGRSVAGSGHRLRKVLLVAQVAVSLTLLVGGLLLVRSIQARSRFNPGFDTSAVVTFSIEPGLHTGDKARRASLYSNLMARVSAIPGVESAAMAWSRPFSNMRNEGAVRALDGISSDTLDVSVITVNEGYFETMGIPIVAGRDFTASDAPEDYRAAMLNVIISESAARTLFGAPAAAVGRLLEPDYPKNAKRQVIGVVGDVQLNQAFKPAQPWMYARLGDDPSWATVHMRVAPGLSAESLAPTLRETLRMVDPTLPLYDLMPVREAIALQMAEDVLLGRLTMAFALIATFLAAVGLYGVLAQSVSERRREIGIRAALGAAPGRVLAWVTADAMRTTAAGALAGLALTAWLGRFIESRLYGIDPFDLTTVAAALAVVAVTSLIAAALPARRASRVDPATVLRL